MTRKGSPLSGDASVQQMRNVRMIRRRQVKAPFQDALDLPAGSDWGTWLKARTGDDHQVFDEVSSLIAARAAMQQPAPIEPPPAASVPANLFGAYRAVGLLGHGGTSAVYRAERADGQYRQTVALKVVAGYLTGPEFVRRFEAERQLPRQRQICRRICTRPLRARAREEIHGKNKA
jgi:serine/threonine-protein kinase